MLQLEFMRLALAVGVVVGILAPAVGFFLVERLVLVRETIVFDGPPSNLPGVWHDPSHTHA